MLSIWQGPAISTNGNELPIATPPMVTVFSSANMALSLVLNQTSLLHGRRDEFAKQRMRLERLGFQLGVVLHADEPGMSGQLNNLGQHAVGRHAGETQPGRFQPVAI